MNEKKLLLYIIAGMIVLAIVANIVFQLILRYRPDLLPAEMREAIDKAKADAEARKAARNR